MKAKSDHLSNDLESHENWIKQLVSGLEMKLLETKQGVNPISALCEKEGNEGVTIACVIETSHIVLHTWPLKKELQLDVYTCGTMDVDFITSHLQWFSPYDVEFKVFDREYELKEIGDIQCQNL